MRMKYTAAIDTAGDSVVGCSQRMRQVGDDMYSYLRNLVSADQLRGEGIQQALEASQKRWNLACNDFANAEQQFGMRCKDSFANMMACDQRAAGYF